MIDIKCCIFLEPQDWANLYDDGNVRNVKTAISRPILKLGAQNFVSIKDNTNNYDDNIDEHETGYNSGRSF